MFCQFVVQLQLILSWFAMVLTLSGPILHMLKSFSIDTGHLSWVLGSVCLLLYVDNISWVWTPSICTKGMICGGCVVLLQRSCSWCFNVAMELLCILHMLPRFSSKSCHLAMHLQWIGNSFAPNSPGKENHIHLSICLANSTIILRSASSSWSQWNRGLVETSH